MNYKVSKASKTGIVFLKISFALQIILLILSYTNFFRSIIKPTSSLSWLTSFADTMTYVTYISIGSCATQFFLIRLFTIQFSGQSGGKIIYLLGCLAAVIYDNWYLIEALQKGLKFGTADYAHLGFNLILTCLILIAIMTSSHTLGVICGIGAFAMAAYNIWVVSQLIGIISTPMVACISACEVLYGIGLALCLFGIHKPEEVKEEVSAPFAQG